MRDSRKYIGRELRHLRQSLGMDQRAMAAGLGISVSYLSQLETDQRPLSATLANTLARQHPTLLEAIEGEDVARRLQGVIEAIASAGGEAVPSDDLATFNVQWPQLAAVIADAHRLRAKALEDLRLVEETMAADAQRRPAWETVRDWFHDNSNYVDQIDRAAEALTGGALFDEAALATEIGLRLEYDEDDQAPLLRVIDGRLILNASLPVETRRFQIAHRAAAAMFDAVIGQIVDSSALADSEARNLLRLGLANYGAGALMMPYETFRAAARTHRHDIDRLSRQFRASFEQTCHRLSTMQRPGAEGVPIYFCRVDMAGNVTKRHSATRMQFARFGGSCPLWIVHEAVAIPDRILVQHAVTTDGVRYVSMAKGMVKAAGQFRRQPRRFAVTVGCEEIYADQFVYADVIDTRSDPTPVGSSCRLCVRADCDQRAFPPIGRAISIDPEVRYVVPYSF